MNTENHSSTLYLLSSGTPTPTQSKFGSAYVLRTGEDYLMFDCGPAATYKMVKAGIKTLVLTHTGSGLSQPESQAKAISDISQVYDGKIVFGEELMKLPIL